MENQDPLTRGALLRTPLLRRFAFGDRRFVLVVLPPLPTFSWSAPPLRGRPLSGLRPKAEGYRGQDFGELSRVSVLESGC